MCVCVCVLVADKVNAKKPQITKPSDYHVQQTNKRSNGNY